MSRGSEKKRCLWLTYDPICPESLDFCRVAEAIEEAAKEGRFALLLILILGLVIMMRSMLPWENLLAATSNVKMELSEEQKAFIEGEERDYSTLPDALILEDGTEITTVGEFETRKAEVLALFEEYVYGTLPKEGFTTSFEVVEEGVALDGKATRKQIKITVETEKGASEALMLLYVPNTDTPSPVIIGLNSNDSGNSGASLSRSNRGETVYSINLAFPHWFCSKYAEYGKNENALPVDQNLLLATIAPRLIYVASAEDDMWADPQGAWNGLMHATNAFELYGLEVIPYSDKQPEVNTPIWTESMGYHVRTGWHDMQAEDWAYYLEYMDTYFVK